MSEMIKKYTKMDVRNALVDWRKVAGAGRFPTCAEWDRWSKGKDVPGRFAVARLYGSWKLGMSIIRQDTEGKAKANTAIARKKRMCCNCGKVCDKFRVIDRRKYPWEEERPVVVCGLCYERAMGGDKGIRLRISGYCV